MEDAHLAEPRLTEDISLFAVFDGHGGIFTLFSIYVKIIKISI